MHLGSFCVLWIILAIVAASACTSQGVTETTAKGSARSANPQPQSHQSTYASTIIPSLIPGSADSTPWIDITAPVISNSSAQTLNQNLSMNPPPPNELMAVWKATGVQLSWETPATVPVPHTYQDEILYYKIYRHTQGSAVTFLAQTTQRTYLDRSVVAGETYYYSVSALHPGEIESLRAKEVSAP